MAGTPEVSSFRATLDTRLSRGSWGISNKILDLPRAPFRSWRVLVAYLLSLAGMVAFFAFLAYAISFGNIHNKAFPFQATCVISNMRQCVDQSESVAYDMIFWIAVSIVGIRLSLTLHARGKKLAALSVREVLTKPDEKYLLYLRPFASDDVKLPLPRLPLVSRLMAPLPFRTLAEEEFFDVADGYMPLIAVGRPGEGQGKTGGVAYREYLSDESWKDYVEDKVLNADKIVFMIGATEGVLWELNLILSLGAAAKTLFFFEPGARDLEKWHHIREAIVPLFMRAGKLPPDFDFSGHAIAFYFSDKTVVEIENSNWSVSSYRTAFSSFLAGRL